jgi:hypothetical protein
MYRVLLPHILNTSWASQESDTEAAVAGPWLCKSAQIRRYNLALGSPWRGDTCELLYCFANHLMVGNATVVVADMPICNL